MSPRLIAGARQEPSPGSLAGPLSLARKRRWTRLPGMVTTTIEGMDESYTLHWPSPYPLPYLPLPTLLAPVPLLSLYSFLPDAPLIL